MIRRPPRSTQGVSSAASDVYKRQVLRARAGLKDPAKPIASFIFLGPTGVGKTELARALAENLFDDERAMIRIDMSEYMEKHSVARLIGAPPGYVGYDEGGQLTEAVRRRPYSVLLFDEIEKAHPDVFNIFLQILDDGRITDSHGRTVDMKNTIIIMTSNIGSDLLLEHPDVDEQLKDKLRMKLRDHFRPEFLNRIDETLFFHSLKLEQLVKIVDIQLEDVARRLAQQGITLEATPAAREYIARTGFDPAFGARPLKRIIVREVETPVSRLLIAGGLPEGSTLSIDSDGHSLSFTHTAKQTQSAGRDFDDPRSADCLSLLFQFYLHPGAHQQCLSSLIIILDLLFTQHHVKEQQIIDTYRHRPSSENFNIIKIVFLINNPRSVHHGYRFAVKIYTNIFAI
eukprot:TRINITY_DN9347_c0_g3_i1.p1 TRINITY_DN9347_c0_g3~~TRINITY_DN9347_c0_g3_i1.p1  ORF type:complete len:400 (+),score=91.58 TRINITY_DN9347_c0_g3_i1:82-1281(+)